jgi:hypothetical protein
MPYNLLKYKNGFSKALKVFSHLYNKTPPESWILAGFIRFHLQSFSHIKDMGLKPLYQVFPLPLA